MKKPILALTMGDPGGIGPEIIAKTFRKFKGSTHFFYLLIGISKPFEILKQKHGLSLPLHFVDSPNPKNFRSDRINFYDLSTPGYKGADFDQAKVSARNGRLAYKTLETAGRWAAQGKVQGIVTAPINKTSMRTVDAHFHGHTEFLAGISKTKHYAMMFVGPKLKVTLVTIHEPISKVSKLIKKKLVLEKIKLTDDFLKNRFKIKSPKIAVCALNPHGRETGTEDESQIRPAVEQARRNKINAVGPFSADQIFYDAYEGRFDAVVSMYHDQGLAPFKMIAFRDGVNVTLGLPFVRTSPDHGTAFDIAYKNKADAASFISSLRLAEKLLR